MTHRDLAERAAHAVSGGRVAHLTSTMVRFDTTNPPGDEAALAHYMGDLLAGIGCDVRYIESAPGRISVLARLPSSVAGAPTLLVNGHLDVVPADAEDWEMPPFDGIIREGVVYGRGTSDMKGGIAAAIEAVMACRDAGVELDSTIVFHLVADEETGGKLGTAWLLNEGLIAADACVVPEPNGMQVGIAERGTLLADIEVHGMAAHGSDPARGRSAVQAAAQVVESLHLAEFAGQAHPLLGSPTCNVGTIVGGTSRNTVGSSALLGIDRRTLPGDDSATLIAELEDMIANAVKADGIDLAIQPVAFIDASEMAGAHPFVEFAASVCRTVDAPSNVGGSTLGSDARFMRSIGIPTIVYGPGDLSRAHTADEFVTIGELVACARSLTQLFVGFGRFFAERHKEW